MKELAELFFKRYEHAMKERYMDILENRLGSVMPLEFLFIDFIPYDISAKTSFDGIHELLNKTQYEEFMEHLNDYIKNMMEEVEEIV